MGFDDLPPRILVQKPGAFAAGDQTRVTADQLKARRSRRNVRRKRDERERPEGRWKDREKR